MFSEDQLVMISLIHGGEEEVALRLISEGAPWGGGVGAILGAGRIILSSSQAKYEAIAIILMGIFA